MMVCAGLIGLVTASLTTIAGSVASRDARSMSRLDVSMLLYLRLFVSIWEPDCLILKASNNARLSNRRRNSTLHRMFQQERGMRERIELSLRGR